MKTEPDGPGPAIDAALARRLVADQFPHWADLPVTPVEVDGWDNRTFRLGEELSVRLPTGDWYALQVSKEQRWLPVLAHGLPLPIPQPVALGAPALGYPYGWSVYRWLEGRPCREEEVGDLTGLAVDLAGFLRSLWSVDAEGGPAPGPHNWFRGAPMAHYAGETLQALTVLQDDFPVEVLRRAWDASASSTWTRPPVWFHGDVAVDNLLVRDHGAGSPRLAAVIDFGCCGVGDPACDLVIGWTLFDGPSRTAFREAMAVDDATWLRGRGWALWKAAITYAAHRHDPVLTARPRRDLERIIAEVEEHGA